MNEKLKSSQWVMATLVAEGAISEDDLGLLQVVDELQKVIDTIFNDYKG